MTLSACLLGTWLLAAAQCLSLAGEWEATLASGKSGTIELPGTLDIAGIGQPDTMQPAMTKPQLLRLTRKVSYIGPCTYSRTVEIPRHMTGKPLRLTMERVLWKSALTIDGKPVTGENISLNSPHTFNIGPLAAGPHLFEITVDNRPQRDISFNNLCHSYTNDTQTIWNGLLGRFTLCVVPPVSFGRPQVYPDISDASIDVTLPVDNSTGKSTRKKITITVTDPLTGRILGKKNVKHPLPAGTSVFTTRLSLDAPSLWDEFSPVVYHLDITDGTDSASTTFGMREVTSEGKNLLVNGKKVFLRGTLDCCVFPLTGVPPTNRAGWEKEMKTIREWGLNHIRFHSWCPPEAAFEVADSFGIYLQTELPVWSLKIGDDPQVDRFLLDEFNNMSQAYGNHPSWIMSTCGNELQHDFNVLNNLAREMKAADPRRLYATTSFTFEKGHGGHAEPEDQFLITQWTDDGWVRGQGVFDSEPPAFNRDYSRSMGCVDVPLISHEIGQYAVYPDLREIDKYTGVLDPLNFKAIRNDLRSKQLLSKAPAFVEATSRFAEILYKEEIERALKTPGFSGFQLLGLQDFPGQGTALVGLVDAFWDAKPGMDAGRFSRCTAPVVPLASFEKAVYTTDETFNATAAVSNFSGSDITDCRIEWKITDNKGISRSGNTGSADIPQGAVINAGDFSLPLDSFSAPSKLTLTLSVPNTEYENSWNIWLYSPADSIKAGNVVITSDLVEACRRLDEGRKVLYLPPADSIAGIESKFLPVFWSPVHFPKQAGGMGIIADPTHPALRGFPNDGHSDWQWWHPVKNARIMDLDAITDCHTGENIGPVVGVIDNFYRNRRLGYMFEARCGNGTLFVSSIDLTADRPEIRSLLSGILDYMDSPAFSPRNEISLAALKSLTAIDSPVETTKETSIYE